MSKLFLTLLLIFAIVAFAEYEVKLIPTDSLDSVESLAPAPGTAMEATSALNIRATPCTDGRLITTVQAGGRMKYVGPAQTACGYTWYKVEGGFGTHWAASNWLRVVGSGGQRINDRGLALIKEFEGLRLCKYKDPVGIWTICYGHTGFDPNRINCVTQAQCDAYLRGDLQRFETCVNNAAKVPLNGNQFSALVSFSYNVGCGALGGSTLLKLLNQRNYGAICTELRKWVYGGGRILPGLVRRREAECKLFTS